MKWKPSQNNPIVDGDKLFGTGYRTEDSKIIKVKNVYYMVISSGKDGDTMDIYLLKSNSLTGPWEKVQEDPIISRGRFYEFDYRYLRVGSINYYNGTYFLYYAGQDMLGIDAIGLATTSDSDFPFGWKNCT